MNVIFMGTPDFSVPILKAVAQQYNVVLVVTQPDKPKGRKKRLSEPPLKKTAEALGLEVFQPRKLRDHTDHVLRYEPDLIITAAYGQILPGKLLEGPRHGAINVHASLLPKLRGGAPIQRAIERGHEKSGVTIMKMGRGMDTGPILRKKAIPIEPDETAGSLFEKLSLLGRDLLMETLDDYVAGKVEPVPQDDREATYAYAIKREEEALDLNRPADALERKIRAFHPAPNTYLEVDGKRLKVLRADCDMETDEGTPGEVLKPSSQGPRIRCKQGALILKEVQPPSKKPMDGLSFMNGAGRTWLETGKNVLE
ncbi:MAG: methionyl-tRNA formyltransferase [Bacillota bacterium]